MSNVLNFRGHHWIRCKRDMCDGCHLCDGGLWACDRCGGAEASLPTHCPGAHMSCADHDAVMGQRIDYDERRGGWISLDQRHGRK